MIYFVKQFGIWKYPIEASENRKFKLNFTKSQWGSLEDLSKDDSIIIKEADKGSTEWLWTSKTTKKWF